MMDSMHTHRFVCACLFVCLFVCFRLCMFMHTHSFVSSTFVAIIDSAYGYRVSIHLSESLHCALASGAVYCNRSCLCVCLL